MLTYRIHLIRHGMTQGNMEGRYIGRTDIPLCERGRSELRALKEQFEYPQVDMVVSSPLQRCTETAQILYPERYMEGWEAFMECDFGEWENKSYQQLQNIPAFAQWLSSGMKQAPPGGESPQQVLARAANGMEKLFERMMKERLRSVALITHGGLISMLLYGMGLPKRPVEQCMVGNGKGYTLLMTPQMWMRDHAFEIYGVAPYGLKERDINQPLKEGFHAGR
ncbi:MAG: histidine phosphatase family protein [Provencibacterium sp.]|nr:histidine phosphatase family protein [Provencibacterium sp.]